MTVRARPSLEQMRTERRVALVVGNRAYQHMRALKNPANDAAASAKALAGRGFEVGAPRLDLTRGQLTKALGDLGRRAAGGVALFYYSGHGHEGDDGRDYLMPVDAQTDSPAAIETSGIAVKDALNLIAQGGSRLQIVILDACRDRPYRSGSGPYPEVRGGTPRRGYGGARAPTGTYLAYSTARGETATDGAGDLSPYAEGFVAALAGPNSRLEDVFKAVRVHVENATERAQVPWEASSVVGDFWFSVPDVEPLPCPDHTQWDGAGCKPEVREACPTGFTYIAGEGCVPPRLMTSSIEFFTEDEGPFEVLVVGSDGEERSCGTLSPGAPCRLHGLPLGLSLAKAKTGHGQIEDELDLNPGRNYASVEETSGAGLAFGIPMIMLGYGSLITGGVLGFGTDDLSDGVGALMMGLGAAVMGGGVAVLIGTSESIELRRAWDAPR